MVRRGEIRAILMVATLWFLQSQARAQVTEAGGVSVFEAEDFVLNLSARSSHDWAFGNSVSGFSGLGYMEATPNTGANLAAGSSSPELQFTVNFGSTGTHYIWVRGYGDSGSDDSVHVGIDGGSSVAMTLSQTSAWQWSNAIQNAAGVASFSVPTTGNHTINVWMREDGIRLDRVVLKTNSAFAARIGNAWHIPNSAEA